MYDPKLSNHFNQLVALLPSCHSVFQGRLDRSSSRPGISLCEEIFNQIRKELGKMIYQLLIRQPFRAPRSRRWSESRKRPARR